eukprot:7701-Heterococcus_DN1.PRE.1
MGDACTVLAQYTTPSSLQQHTCGGSAAGMSSSSSGSTVEAALRQQSCAAGEKAAVVHCAMCTAAIASLPQQRSQCIWQQLRHNQLSSAVSAATAAAAIIHTALSVTGRTVTAAGVKDFGVTCNGPVSSYKGYYSCMRCSRRDALQLACALNEHTEP